MAELTLKQIEDKLNEQFAGDGRKLIFWYDENQEFVNDVDTLVLENAKVYRLYPDEQFKTKVFLEREDTATNYLIYAPFSKPAIRDNHLADILLYSQEFFTDRISLIISELNIPEGLRKTMFKYQKFFGSKERANRFIKYEMDYHRETDVEISIMSALCKTRVASFEEVIRVLLDDDQLEDSQIFKEFEKYGLTEAFWQLCQDHFGYIDDHPSLNKLVIRLFVTYTNQEMTGGIPRSWDSFVLSKSGTVMAFLDNFMNNRLYTKRYNQLSESVAKALHANEQLSQVDPSYYINCDTFTIFDENIIKWTIERLLDENLGATIQDMTIPEICKHRSYKHFRDKYWDAYHVIKHAYYIVQAATYRTTHDLDQIVKRYIKSDYRIDTHYRKFYYYYDRLTDHSIFERLREFVENIYTNRYLDVIIPAWNHAIDQAENLNINYQINFYQNHILPLKDRVIVIISDALRYEVGRNLVKKLERDPKNTTSIDVMLGVLPSYTRLGMAALLPHKTINLTDDYRVFVDGKAVDSLKQREDVLKGYEPESFGIQYDDLMAMSRDERRQAFVGKRVIYIYHNQIDARGDKLNTENEVFKACEEAIDEIHDLIRRLTGEIRATHYIVTADHGFIYKRDKIEEAHKIDHLSTSDDYINRRFIISKNPYDIHGTKSIELKRITNREDDKWVTFPISSHVFKVAGGGQNYVHGGSSPQELLIPLIEVKTERGKVDTEPAKIALISRIPKITNLITILEFIQSDPISDIITPTTYKLYFKSEDGEIISNENIYVADSKESDAARRIFRLRFTFKNQAYDRKKRYYLMIEDIKNEVEIFRQDVVMDIAFAGDFGFNVK